MFRNGSRFKGERDPTRASQLSNNRRPPLFNGTMSASSGYVSVKHQMIQWPTDVSATVSILAWTDFHKPPETSKGP